MAEKEKKSEILHEIQLCFNKARYFDSELKKLEEKVNNWDRQHSIQVISKELSQEEVGEIVKVSSLMKVSLIQLRAIIDISNNMWVLIRNMDEY